MEKKLYELQELTQEEYEKKVNESTTIMDVIDAHEGEDESPVSLMITTDKDEAFKELNDYIGECTKSGCYYTMRYARLVEYTIDMDDLDEDAAKELEFEGKKTTDLKAIDQAISENCWEFDEYFNNDFTNQKVIKD